MLNKIISFSISNKLVVGLFILFLIGYGTYQVTKLPIDAVPDITDNQVQVITTSPSLGAPDVERLITFPVEQVNSNIPGLKEIRSFSRFGLSVVTIVFNDDVDVYWARQQVNERLQQALDQIPKQFGIPKLAPVTTGLGEIYQYCIRPKKGYENSYDAMKLRTIQDWIVRRQLLGVKGVAEVASFGGNLKQYEIAVDPAKLSANNVTMSEVFAALESNNQNTGGAYIEKGPTVLFIRSEGLVGSISDIENIVVKNLPDGTPLLIHHVGEVHLGSATRYGAMTYNGEQEVSGAVVMMLKGANSNEVISNIKERINQIQKSLPEGVIIDPFLDRTKMVDNSISTVTRNLFEGALIVLAILIIFLGNFRAAFLVASVIPLAMLFAIIMMNMFGVSGNLMSLGALDFGLIIDGAVIIVEAVTHHIQTRNKDFTKGEMDVATKEVASRMSNTAVFGEIIILVVYIPIFTLRGIEGKMFLPMAQTVAFALLGAFILSITYIPMMSALFLRRSPMKKGNISARIMEWLEQVYSTALVKVINFRKTVIAVSVVLFFGALLILFTLGGEFIPVLPEGDFAVETRVLAGSNLKTSVDAVSKASKILLEKFPDIEKIVGKTGSSEVPTDPMPIEASDIMIILKSKDQWTSASTYDELIEKMSGELESIPGVTFGFQYPVAMRFNELMTGARQDVVCKIFGDNLDTLAIFARKLGDLTGTIDGVNDIYVEAVTGMPQIVIQYNRQMIAQYGLDINSVNRIVNTAFAGQSSGLVFEGERRFDLVVRLAGEQRKDLQSVENLLIPTPKGNQVPLAAVAKVEVVDGPNQIQREDAQRRIVVGFNVRGRDVQSIVKELQQKVDQHIKFPVGYHVTYGGAFENLQAAKNRLSLAVPLSLVLIFFLLYFTFHSARQALLIYSAIPLSAIGGIMALAVRGMPFSISAGVGFIALFGVSVLNGIVLVAEFNRLRKEGAESLKDIILQGARTRLRPVLMTALVASFGFLPMALSTGEGAEVQRPLATVVIGGLLVATFLTLFVLPILYLLFEKKHFQRSQRFPVAILLITFSLCAMPGKSQSRISLSSAIDTALKNNLSVRGERLQAEYLAKLKGTAYALPMANVAFDYGQMNSAFYDSKISIQQSLKFPTVYAAQKKVYDEQWKSGIMNIAIQENELKRRVTSVYYELVYLEQKQKLLLYADSLFASFLKNAELRFTKGETNILEKTTAETQRGQVNIQLENVKNSLSVSLLEFKWFLNSANDLVPDENSLKMPAPMINDTSQLRQHPLIKELRQQEIISKARLKFEKSKLAPDIFASYNNMTIQGYGADEKFYSGSNRFQSFQVGIGIPLFFKAQGAGVKAMKLDLLKTQALYMSGMQTIQSKYQQALLKFQRNINVVKYYEESALRNAEEILNAANLQFKNGNVNYLEWVLFINNAISIQSLYLDAVKEMNESAIEINSYLNK
jgi:cobalt-zinc-cadmium resistance protein CzcA